MFVSMGFALTCPEYADDDNPTFYPNPEDCSSYYKCDSGGVPVKLPCPPNQHWNTRINVCDSPSNVNCGVLGKHTK